MCLQFIEILTLLTLTFAEDKIPMVPLMPNPLPDRMGIQSSPHRFKDGDRAFRERRNPEKARIALEKYRGTFKKNPEDWEAAWRVAMAAYFVGIRLTQDSETLEQLYAEGRDAGLGGTTKNPKCAPCYFWGAINYALYADTIGILKLLFALGTLEEYLKKSIELQPDYAYAGAYRLLGTVEEKLPGIFGGSDDEARRYYELAIQTAPEEPLNYIFLARLLENEFDERGEALRIANLGLKVPAPTPDRLEAADALKDLETFISEYSK